MPEVRCPDLPTTIKHKYVYVCMKYFRFFLISGHFGVDLQRIATNIIPLVGDFEQVQHFCFYQERNYTVPSTSTICLIS